MYDTSELIATFHDEHVRLSLKQSQDMQSRRDANISRLSSGLKELSKPSIAETINQGGNAMQTMTQPPEADEECQYDIDVGVVFEASDSKEPATVKEWVRAAIAKKAPHLKHPPVAKKKCVRVTYADGYQCDLPVFQRHEVGDTHSYEIAIGDEWIASDPQSMNRWFAEKIKELSPEEESGFQLRRIARLLKYFSKVHSHRTGCKFPAGLLVTALAVESYCPVAERDDEAFYRTLAKLATRSEHAGVLANNVVISSNKDSERIRRLSDAASEAAEALDVLANSPDDVSESEARKAWKEVFRHSYFDEADATKIETKSATGLGPAIASLSDNERLKRAEAAIREVEQRGSQGKPWAK